MLRKLNTLIKLLKNMSRLPEIERKLDIILENNDRNAIQPESSYSPQVEDRYTEIFTKHFGVPPISNPKFLHFPFAWGTPEAMRLQRTIWAIESETVWGRLMDALAEDRIQGDLVEFGVAGGASLGQLISHRAQAGLSMKVYGFDSFEGLPAPSEYDGDIWKEGEFAANYEEVVSLLDVENRPWLRLIKGWFSETLPQYDDEIELVAFARIDCDLYESTKTCLDFLHGKLANGSVLLFDDWTDNVETGETKAFFEYLENNHEYEFEPVSRIAIGGMHFRVWHKK